MNKKHRSRSIAVILAAMAALILSSTVACTPPLGGTDPAPSGGGLTYLGQYSSRINGMSKTALSPDGANLYAFCNDSIVWFDRNASSGAIAYGGKLAVNTYGPDMCISPDGRQLYGTRISQNAITIFDRASGGGAVSLRGTFSVAELTGCYGAYIANDGLNLYVFTYPSSGTYAVAWLSRDPVTGALSYAGSYSNSSMIRHMHGMAESPDGNNLYVIDNNGSSTVEDSIVWFTRSAIDGSLSFGGRYSFGSFAEPERIAVSPDGASVHVYLRTTATIVTFSRNPANGSLGYASGYTSTDLHLSKSLVISPDGASVYCVTGMNGPNAIVWLDRNASSGAISADGSIPAGAMRLEGLVSINLSPDGRFAYVADGLADAVLVFDVNTATGGLSFSRGFYEPGIDDAGRVLVSGDGRNLYVSPSYSYNPPYQYSVAWFGVNQASGVPENIDNTFDIPISGGLGYDLSNMVISPNDRDIYFCIRGDAGPNEKEILVYRRDITSGSASFNGYTEIDNLTSGPFSLAITPDGKYLFMTDYGMDAVLVYGRNDTTGNLSFIRKFTSEKINGASAAVVSPGGDYLYVVAKEADSVAWYSIDGATGFLTYQGRHAGTDIEGVCSITLTPDGTSAYACASVANAVAWFTRDAETGALYYTGRYVGNAVREPGNLAVSPDGANVYVIAGYADNLVCFTREQGTGALRYQGSYHDAGLVGLQGITTSPDGRMVFVTAGTSGALAWFRRGD